MAKKEVFTGQVRYIIEHFALPFSSWQSLFIPNAAPPLPAGVTALLLPSCPPSSQTVQHVHESPCSITECTMRFLTQMMKNEHTDIVFLTENFLTALLIHGALNA